MEQTGGLANLAERLKEKTEQERIQTERVFTEQLQTLSSNLQASSQNALRTMSDAMAQEITNATESLNHHYNLLSLAFGKKWVSTTILGFFLCLGMMLAGWGTVKYWGWRLQSYRNERERLEKACQVQREEWKLAVEAVEVLNQTSDALMNQTSGVAIVERNGSRFVTAPIGSESGYKVNGRPAIKLME